MQQFLPIEIQASIEQLRVLRVPEEVLDQLTNRILKASEAKTTSLQMDLERIETSFERRYNLIEAKLIADNQTRTTDIYQMLSEIRGAQQITHPQIAHLATTFDHATNERIRLEAKIDALDERLTVVEQILEITPADGDAQ